MRDYEEKSYYEIQLDNKQLILVFLAAVTVCVLIFVLGVMIGKGQKEAEFAATSRDDKKSAAVEPDANSPQQPLPDTAAAEADPEEKSPPRVDPVAEKPAPVRENRAKEQQEKSAANDTKQPAKFAYEDLDKNDQTPAVKKEEPETLEAPVEAPVAETEEPKPSGKSRYTVQVMATSSKPKAQEQISRLKLRGYKPFMDESKTGEISVFKVRVGRFAETDEAKKMASKIKNDLKLETWVAELD